MFALQKYTEGKERDLLTANVQQLYQTILLMIHKHFKKWATKNLYFGLFSEGPTGSGASHILLGVEFTHSCKFHSEENKQEIDVRAFYDFVKKKYTHKSLQETRQNVDLQNKQNELMLIKNRMNMWSNFHNDTPLGHLRKDFIKKYAAQFSNFQINKRGMKESGHVSYGR